jgi:hypothetical protein
MGSGRPPLIDAHPYPQREMPADMPQQNIMDDIAATELVGIGPSIPPPLPAALIEASSSSTLTTSLSLSLTYSPVAMDAATRRKRKVHESMVEPQPIRLCRMRATPSHAAGMPATASTSEPRNKINRADPSEKRHINSSEPRPNSQAAPTGLSLLKALSIRMEKPTSTSGIVGEFNTEKKLLVELEETNVISSSLNNGRRSPRLKNKQCDGRLEAFCGDQTQLDIVAPDSNMNNFSKPISIISSMDQQQQSIPPAKINARKVRKVVA